MSNTLIIIENQSDWAPYFKSDSVITFSQYLAHQYPVSSDENIEKNSEKALDKTNDKTSDKSKAPRLRIINLCKSSDYLSVGYYCSLLAEARGHNVIPSIRTLNDLSQQELTDLELNFIPSLFANSSMFGQIQVVPLINQIHIISFFGTTNNSQYAEFARKVFEHFPCPILRITLHFNNGWHVQSIESASPASLTETEEDDFANALDHFSGKVWRKKRINKPMSYDLAILVDPDEKLPPSDKKALKKFIAAGKSLGIDCELITPKDYLRLAEFDGLFIRSTTAIDNFTYRFAKRAELDGLVVIDDSNSILRCTNKIYLADLFNRHHVSAPKTVLLRMGEQAQIDQLESTLGYPMVLKIPDGAFSIGVEKVKNAEELNNALDRLFQRSALLLAQEYLYTEYDWRIGVLNNKAIYACRYYMVKNHWQIYHHDTSRVLSGSFETFPVEQAPKAVLEAALKATKPIGNGLYGVDIKAVDDKGYVIEVNDNPSIDSGLEDLYLGDELYLIIMKEFLRRMSIRRNYKA